MLTVSDGVSEYPLSTSTKLARPQTMPWRYNWWLRSDFRLLADKDVRIIAFDLFCVALDQEPIGTLPNDERLLARLVGEPLEDWRKLMARKIGPLHGWSICTCGGAGHRLFHPVSLEIAKEALHAEGKA